MSNNTSSDALHAITNDQLTSVIGGKNLLDKAKDKARQAVENAKNVTKATVNGVYNIAAGAFGYNNENGDPGIPDNRKPFQDDPLSKIKYE